MVRDDVEAIMFDYFVNKDGVFSYYAFEAGRMWCEHFKLRSSAIVRALLPDKLTPAPSYEDTLVGIEGPMFDIAYNPFWQENAYRVMPVIQNEIARQSSARKIGKDQAHLAASLMLSSWEFIPAIAGCVQDLSWQRECDYKVRLYANEVFNTLLNKGVK